MAGNEAMKKLRVFVRQNFTPEAAEIMLARLKTPPNELERALARQAVASKIERAENGLPPAEES